jgi:AcrR family transcriptional regulator
MARTRAAVLDGAALSIARYGTRRATMADIAALGGVAKATLYNHFRRKADVYVALARAEVAHIASAAAAPAADDLGAALALAAELVADHPVVRRLAVDEPQVLTVLVNAALGEHSAPVRAAVAEVLTASGRDADPDRVDLVLRWVTSHLAAPGDAASRAAGGALLASLVGA